MAKRNLKNLGNEFLENVWGKRVRGLPALNIDLSAPVRPQDVLFLLNRYPFLQIVNTQPQNLEGIDIQLITSKSGWIIHFYGDAMSSSPGKLLFGPQDEEKEGGVGTIVNQAFLTAQEMAMIAMERGWAGLQIVDGHRLMQWALWVQAEELSLQVYGFEPTKEEIEKKARIRKYLQEIMAANKPRLGR